MLLKCCTQYASKFEKLSSGHRTGSGPFSFQSLRKTMPKNVQTTTQFCSFHIVVVQLPSCIRLFATPWTTACQASLSFTISWSCSNSCPLSQWCHPTISPSVTPFSSCPQFSPALETFPMSLLFISGGQNIGASASASFQNIQG